jgi:hypothetical protein
MDRKPAKRELVPDKYISDGLLYVLWKLAKVDYSNPRQLFEFGFEYIKPHHWENKDLAYKLFALSEQFGVTLQNPRFEEGYFKDSHPDDYKEIVKLTEEELKKEPEVFDKLFNTKNRILARKKALEGKNLTMEDAKELALDIIPINITHLYDGIWFEVRPNSNAKKKLSNFLDIYLANFINDKLIGQPQTLDYSLIKPQNFYTFEKHRFWGDFKLREMQEKYGTRFTLTGLVSKDKEFLHIHYLLALDKLGLVKIGRLGTNSGAYTHGDDPQWEVSMTLQPSFNNQNKSILDQKIIVEPYFSKDKKREWIDFFKKIGVIRQQKQTEELEKELSGFSSPFWSSTTATNLLKEADDIIAEAPEEIKKMDWLFREYNSTPYSLEKSRTIILASLDKLSEKYETIPLVYTTLPLPSYVNYPSQIWREILSTHSFEKEDCGHLDFLNALASLVKDKVFGLLSFETIWADDKSLVFKVTVVGYNKRPTKESGLGDVKAGTSFNENKGILALGDKEPKFLISKNNLGQYFFSNKPLKFENTDTIYFKIFDVLYEKADTNGFCSYGEINKFLQESGEETLTDKAKIVERISNGLKNLLRYSNLPKNGKIQDGKPLIKTKRGKGLIFYNPPI